MRVEMPMALSEPGLEDYCSPLSRLPTRLARHFLVTKSPRSKAEKVLSRRASGKHARSASRALRGQLPATQTHAER